MNIRTMRKSLVVCTLVVGSLFTASPLMANLLVNPNFNQGPDNLDGYEAFAFWQQGAVSFGSGWGLADAPFTADGGGTAVFGMNTQLATDDPFWIGASQVMTIQQNFWTPDNTESLPGVDLYGQTLTFSGTALVTEPYAPGNLGEIFIQFLDQSWNAIGYFPTDVSALGPSGAFSITATVPDSGLNIVQVGFRNSGIEGTAGEMTVSGLVLVPEPGSFGLLALGALGISMVRRRRHLA